MWAGVGLALALSSLPAVNADARVFVGLACLFGPAAAILAAFALEHRRTRAAGVLLVLSVVTPTFFAYVLNIPAFAVGLTLLVWPRTMVKAEVGH
jgi:hypothetical protein